MAGFPQYDVSVFPYLRDSQRLLDLIPTRATEAPSMWTEVTAPVQRLAHFTRVNDEVIADFDNLLDVVGLRAPRRADQRGDRTAERWHRDRRHTSRDSSSRPPAFSPWARPGPTSAASPQGFLANRTGASHCDPDVVVMNPADWFSAGFLLAKDTAGQYLVGDPVTGVEPSHWGSR